MAANLRLTAVQYSIAHVLPFRNGARMHYVHLMQSDSKGEELVTLQSRSLESLNSFPHL